MRQSHNQRCKTVYSVCLGAKLLGRFSQPVKMKTCFVIMPIGSDEAYRIYLNRYENLIKPAIEGVLQGDLRVFDAIRADFISRTGSINHMVLRHLYEADVVIADLTDLNPNVLYELGVRNALRHGTIL